MISTLSLSWWCSHVLLDYVGCIVYGEDVETLKTLKVPKGFGKSCLMRHENDWIVWECVVWRQLINYVIRIDEKCCDEKNWLPNGIQTSLNFSYMTHKQSPSASSFNSKDINSHSSLNNAQWYFAELIKTQLLITIDVNSSLLVFSRSLDRLRKNEEAIFVYVVERSTCVYRNLMALSSILPFNEKLIWF